MKPKDVKTSLRETAVELQTKDAPPDPRVLRRKSAIAEVERAICVDRNQTHGDAEDNFQNIADTWNMILRTRGVIGLTQPGITSSDVAAMMTAFKICRYASNPNQRDHLLDAGGYALCGVGILDSFMP